MITGLPAADAGAATPHFVLSEASETALQTTLTEGVPDDAVFKGDPAAVGSLHLVASSKSSSRSRSRSGPNSGSGAKVSSARSGLPWASGFSCFNRAWSKEGELAKWRGRDLDVVKGWAPKGSWDKMLKWTRGGGLGALVKSKARPVVSVPLLTENTKGQFDNCARGAFDRYHREAAQVMKSRGASNAIIRLGWEANGSWFPWSAGKNPEGYKKCFRRAAQTIKSVDKNFKIEWPMAKKGHLKFNVDKIYPGGDVVDIIGVVLYDRYPSFNTQKVWDKYYNAKFNGGPYGPGAWLKYAKSKGKLLAIGEWGISNGYTRQSKDNPIFIENVYKFLKNNSKNIAYASYYNCRNENTYRIFPKHVNPKSSAAYKRLWSR